jgi:hypothetical protein
VQRDITKEGDAMAWGYRACASFRSADRWAAKQRGARGARTAGATRVRLVALAVPLALMLMALSAATAQANVGKTTITCTSVAWSFEKFPNANNNTVTETITINGSTVSTKPFSFNGPTGSNTTAISATGSVTIVASASWNTNGAKGSFSNEASLNCGQPNFRIEKLQMIAGSGGSFTTSELTGKPGQVVDYEIIVENTGSTSLEFGPLDDEECENIVPSGSVTLAPGAKETYTCEHTLKPPPPGQSGRHINCATATGTPPSGSPITKTSNCVVVKVPAQPPTCPANSIVSNFNGTAIPAGDWIWFNSVLKAKGAGSGGTIKFTNQTLKFGSTTVSVPNASITFSTSATKATTTFTGGGWVTTVPASFGDNVFLSGLAYHVPTTLPGGINPVTWQGDFTLSPGLSLQWQWGAAVYTQFTNSYNELGVKPAHSTSIDSYHTGDQAGTPEAFKQGVTGGARGGGGSNFTGSYSATGHCP